MAVNPYTMNHLYNQGIIDYVPYNLTGGPFYPLPTGEFNPYLQSAMQGNLYHTYGEGCDTFTNSLGGVNGNLLFNNSTGGINGFGNSGKPDGFSNMAKGLLSCAMILGTAYLCLRGKKKAPVKTENTGFWSKLIFWKKNK